MIRTVAAILAKKTAIVAITGVTVIGGGTLALANTDVIPDGTESSTETETETSTETESSTETETETSTETETESESESEEASEEPIGITADEECGDDTPDDSTLDDTTSTDDGTDVDALATEDTECDDLDEGGPVGNHGAVVTEAIKTGECSALTGKVKGQCVANVATGGKKVAPEDETEVEEPAPVVEEEPVVEEQPTIETQTVAEKPGKGAGKPDHAGPPAGKGPKG
jgi:hypothetical protein